MGECSEAACWSWIRRAVVLLGRSMRRAAFRQAESPKGALAPLPSSIAALDRIHTVVKHVHLRLGIEMIFLPQSDRAARSDPVSSLLPQPQASARRNRWRCCRCDLLRWLLAGTTTRVCCKLQQFHTQASMSCSASLITHAHHLRHFTPQIHTRWPVPAWRIQHASETPRNWTAPSSAAPSRPPPFRVSPLAATTAARAGRRGGKWMSRSSHGHRCCRSSG